ncbi:MAG: hypothetical protein C0498_01330 [Anaerolinea sp.]|nr:hypothetical protein [Anaerolinea sp.]
MDGLYDLTFSLLAGDPTLQALLGGSASDRKVYPVEDLGRVAPPAIAVAVVAGPSDVAFGVDRPTLVLTIASAVSATEVVAIASRVEALLNRKRLAGNGRLVHLCLKDNDTDDFDPDAREFVRDVRYRLIAQ